MIHRTATALATLATLAIAPALTWAEGAYPWVACETDRVQVLLAPAGECTPYSGPTLGPGEPQFGPGGTCLGPACEPPCENPLAWVPDGRRLVIRLEVGAE